MPFRRIVRPAPEVVLKRRSRISRCCFVGRLTITLARWKASETPNPSIVWYFLLRSIVIVVVDCLDNISELGIAATAMGIAAAMII